MNKSAIKLAIQNGRMTPDLDEHESSFEEWLHLREVAFSKLRKDGFIPGELIDLVEDLKEQTPVQLYLTPVHDESCPESSVNGLRIGVKVVGTGRKEDVVDGFGGAGTDEHDSAISASEALALLLRISLRELKDAEKNPGAAPVRLGNLLSRSLIAEIACGLLDRCQDCDYSPGPELVGVLRELANLQSYKQGAPREFDARQRAISILAQIPETGVRKLAKQVDVDPTTVSRWCRDPEFNEEVRRRTEWIKKPNCLTPIRENHE